MGGITGLLLLLWVGVRGSTAVNVQKRILGGQFCYRPYHVIITTSEKRFSCGGSLISDRWVLTAAHCWMWDMNVVIDWHSPHPITMRIRAPPVLYGDNNHMIHDIMLLRLPQQLRPARHIALPNCNNRLRVGDAVQIAGHGATTVNPDYTKKSEFTPNLQCTNIRVHECSWLGNLNHPEGHQYMFCGDSARTDGCPGDSGGGVVFHDQIYGVITTTGVHAHAAPVGFMHVCGYIQWITDTINRP